QQDHPIAHRIHLVEDVTRQDQVQPFARKLLEQPNRFRASHWIETVQRLIEDHHRRRMRDCLSEPHPLSHALAVAGHLAMRSFEQVYSVKRVPGHVLRVTRAVAVYQKVRPHKLKSGDALWKRIELRAVTYLAKQPLGFRTTRAQNDDAASRRP